MRLGFSQTLSDVLHRADEQARGLNHDFVGTEHLLLGILAGDQKSLAFKAIKSEAEIDEVKAHLVKVLSPAGDTPLVTGRLPLSQKAQQTLNAAMSDAQAAGAPSVTSKYLLRALLEDDKSAITQALRDSGADLESLRALLARDHETES
jgi:ATP-dependent Clp protease ATP-binding subunit ClpC